MPDFKEISETDLMIGMIGLAGKVMCQVGFSLTIGVIGAVALGAI